MGWHVDIEHLNQWLSALALVISIITALGLWLSKPSKEMAAKIETVRCDQEKFETVYFEGAKGHDRRIQAVETELRHLPTSDDFGRLQITVTKVEGDMKRIEETLTRVGRVVDRIDDHLRSAT